MEKKRGTNKRYTELAKGRITDTRQIIVSKVNATGTYKLAELAEFREGNKTQQMILKKSQIEVTNIEYLIHLRDAINIAIQKETEEDAPEIIIPKMSEEELTETVEQTLSSPPHIIVKNEKEEAEELAGQIIESVMNMEESEMDNAPAPVKEEIQAEQSDPEIEVQLNPVDYYRQQLKEMRKNGLITLKQESNMLNEFKKQQIQEPEPVLEPAEETTTIDDDDEWGDVD